MEKFNRTAHGYDPEQVNAFLDQVINQVEKIVGELKVRDERILELEEELAKQDSLRERLGQYQRMEDTLNKALFGSNYYPKRVWGKYCNQDRQFSGRLRLWKEGWWKWWTPQVVVGSNDVVIVISYIYRFLWY